VRTLRNAENGCRVESGSTHVGFDPCRVRPVEADGLTGRINNIVTIILVLLYYCAMKLESTIFIMKAPQEVWSYLSDVTNVAKWDGGVNLTRPISAEEPGIGYEFETFSDDRGGGRMAYRIVQADPVHGSIVRLISNTGNARFFKSAQWHFHLKGTPDGTLLTCSAEFELRLRYVFLLPVFRVMRRAVHSDLLCLKKALEA
jgi:hypothetical protein